MQEQYNNIFKELLDKCDTTDKQAMAMATILLADKISTEVIFKDNNYLKIEDIKEYLNSKKDIDISERAYDWTIGWIAQNKNKFIESSNTEIWGKYDEKNNICLINRNVYDEELKKAGFDYRAIIRKFDEKNLILRNSQGKFINNTHVFGMKASYIKLIIQQEELEDTEDIEELPF